MLDARNTCMNAGPSVLVKHPWQPPDSLFYVVRLRDDSAARILRTRAPEHWQLYQRNSRNKERVEFALYWELD